MPTKLIAPMLLIAACATDTDLADPRLGPASTTGAAAATATAEECTPSQLRTDLPWYGDNRATLTGWLDTRGCASPDYRGYAKPVATFDWDNTISKQDFGDAFTFFLIKNDKVLQPAGYDWKQTSRYMTDAGAAALAAACGSDVAPGQPLPTSTNLGCADEMLSMYINNVTRGGAVAFAGHNFRRMEPTYAWTAQLAAGYTPVQIRQMTLDAVTPQLAAPIGTTQVVGTQTVNGWLRIYDQTVDLIHAAQTRGYDVWIVTASPQYVIAAVSEIAGIAPNHVVGIRQVADAEGKLTAHIQGCGPVADGDDSMISYIEGKRCWINKVIFGDTTAQAIDRRPVDQRQVFAAGDSDTDTDFLRDAAYKLVINRNKNEVMCFAYHNEGDSWRVNPMFILPRARKSSLYPCSTTACVAADGTKGPCIDDAGLAIPDQADTVF
jgi:phosphoserine phosphatase